MMNIDQIYDIWRDLKDLLRFDGQISADAMHINLGLLGFFLFLYLFRNQKSAAIKAWLVVFVFQFLNEVIDIYFDLQILGTVKEWNSIKDFSMTLLWPSLFTAYFYKRSRARS